MYYIYILKSRYVNIQMTFLALVSRRPLQLQEHVFCSF